MRISDWSSYVCSSDLFEDDQAIGQLVEIGDEAGIGAIAVEHQSRKDLVGHEDDTRETLQALGQLADFPGRGDAAGRIGRRIRSEACRVAKEWVSRCRNVWARAY